MRMALTTTTKEIKHYLGKGDLPKQVSIDEFKYDQPLLDQVATQLKANNRKLTLQALRAAFYQQWFTAMQTNLQPIFDQVNRQAITQGLHLVKLSEFQSPKLWRNMLIASNRQTNELMRQLPYALAIAPSRKTKFNADGSITNLRTHIILADNADKFAIPVTIDVNLNAQGTVTKLVADLKRRCVLPTSKIANLKDIPQIYEMYLQPPHHNNEQVAINWITGICSQLSSN